MYNGLDHAFIYLFSPLLPTKTPGIFLIACFTWGNGCSAEDRIRAVFRIYLIFKVENKQITYVDQLDQGEDANDFCGFGF